MLPIICVNKSCRSLEMSVEGKEIMFGYIELNSKSLPDERVARYKAWYCGLCGQIREAYGQLGRLSLSNDMTFLAVLLSSLYEPSEQEGKTACPLHPIRDRDSVITEMTRYAADMNMLLAYWKYRDGERDEGSRVQKHLAEKMQHAISTLETHYPHQASMVQEKLEAIWALEEKQTTDVDRLCSLSGEMLGAVFVYREDVFAPVLFRIGEGLGRFVYLMDAYEDKKADRKHGRYNPLLLMQIPDEEQVILDSMNSMLAAASEALDALPLERDLDLIRNVLYEGVWNRYVLMHNSKKTEEVKRT